MGEEEIFLSFLAELTNPQCVCGNHNSSRKFPWRLRKGASLLPFSMGSAGPPFFWKEEEEIPSHDSIHEKQTVNVTGKRCRSCKCKLMGHGNQMGKRTWYFEPSPAGFKPQVILTLLWFSFLFCFLNLRVKLPSMISLIIHLFQLSSVHEDWAISK